MCLTLLLQARQQAYSLVPESVQTMCGMLTIAGQPGVHVMHPLHLHDISLMIAVTSMNIYVTMYTALQLMMR